MPDLDTVRDWLYDEAWLLDNREYDSWLELLQPDVRYRVALRVVRDVGAPELETAIVDEALPDLRIRVAQIGNPKYTYAENPPSFMRRFVTNVRLTNNAGELLSVRSYVAAYRNGGTLPEAALYAGVRYDELARHNDGLRLQRRNVVLDQALMTTMNLSVLL